MGTLPPSYDVEDTVHGLLRNGHFIASLAHCRLLIAHSLDLAAYLRTQPILAGIPLRVLPHPMGLAERAPQVPTYPLKLYHGLPCSSIEQDIGSFI